MADCWHPVILVTYHHPHSDIHDVSLADLVKSSPAQTRRVMTVGSPRCSECGNSLRKLDLADRIAEGGDLFDRRVRFVW